MFFIFSFNNDSEDLDYKGQVTCPSCGRKTQVKISMDYNKFSLFFIPIIKSNRRFYLRTMCCNSLYELDKKLGNKIYRSRDVEIEKGDLVLLTRGTKTGKSSYYRKEERERTRRCERCGQLLKKDFKYCPNCGKDL